MQFRTTAMRARKTYRQGMDYSILWAVVMWGLNIVDATTSAHLKGFDISDNLSLQVQPAYQPDTKSAGVKMVFFYNK